MEGLQGVIDMTNKRIISKNNYLTYEKMDLF